MLGDATIREGYVQGSMARGFEAAGSNPGGATGAFVGMGMGMGAGGSMFGAMSETNREQMRRDAEAPKSEPVTDGWSCSCGSTGNKGNFCQNCGSKKPEEKRSGVWTCQCGNECTGKFCPNCGTKRPGGDWICPDCGTKNGSKGKFCQNCGRKKD